MLFSFVYVMRFLLALLILRSSHIIADKEYARLHSEYGLEKKSVLDTIEKYAKELGLEYGSVSYYMMCDSKFADDIGEIVK